MLLLIGLALFYTQGRYCTAQFKFEARKRIPRMYFVTFVGYFWKSCVFVNTCMRIFHALHALGQWTCVHLLCIPEQFKGNVNTKTFTTLFLKSSWLPSLTKRKEWAHRWCSTILKKQNLQVALYVHMYITACTHTCKCIHVTSSLSPQQVFIFVSNWDVINLQCTH